MIVLPNTNVRVLDTTSELYYFDTQSAPLPRERSPLEAWNVIMAHPQPILKIAFQIRDAVSSLFGVKSIKGFSGETAKDVQVGGHLDFFLVEYTDKDCLVLTERDTHLDVMTCISTQGSRVTITSSVQVHNWFGRFYMVPVGIAHKWIVRGMLKRLQREVSD